MIIAAVVIAKRGWDVGTGILGILPYVEEMHKDVLDYRGPSRQEDRAAQSPAAAAIRLLALSVLFFTGGVMLVASALEYSFGGGWLVPLGVAGFLVMLVSGVSFALSFFGGPH